MDYASTIASHTPAGLKDQVADAVLCCRVTDEGFLSDETQAIIDTVRQQDTPWSSEIRALNRLLLQSGLRVEHHHVIGPLRHVHDAIAWMIHVLRGRREVEIAGLPLWQIPIPSPCPNEVYERAMAAAMRRAVEEGFTHVAFGDLFLEDIRRYREERLAGTGLTPLFPLFGADTAALALEMVTAGLGARITCVDPRVLDRSFAGRDFDASLLADLPPSIDPCGERGEFHTFAYRGPMFAHSIAIESGPIVERDGFVFADVLPAARATA